MIHANPDLAKRVSQILVVAVRPPEETQIGHSRIRVNDMVSGQEEVVKTPAAKAGGAIRFLIGASVLIHIANRVDYSNAVCPDTSLAGFLPN